MVGHISAVLSLLFTVGLSETTVQASTVGVWLENIAVRKNGDLVITQLRPAILHTVRDPTAKKVALTPIYTWNVENVTDLLGITETFPDTFNVIAGNATADAQGYPGTFSSWEVKFDSSSSTPKVRKIANIPEAKLLNGNVAVPSNPKIVLIADSQFGLLFRLDTVTGKYEIIADRPELKPRPEIHNDPVGFGINGIKIRGNYLYFSSSNLVSIYRVKITSDGYIAHDGKAPIEKYADLNDLATFIDDFAIGDDGTIWAITNFDNNVIAISPKGKKEVVVGSKGSLTVAGGTAAAFGRTKKDKDILYVTTSGALANPVNGTITEPGKVVAIDTTGYKN
ncbi:hypothetical protein B0J11DRAFT_557992 [Dendryphion nanum]|uniref:SMP-30/Gluconolactonase/LRE-like region domain-containing protein n=1 Tax=Dendryphion nanum TaxID=256645 RepID=A0A9P9E0F9_9PLEO|nr:hypothetical protein B0J11DRAFT_557992 [Dendryphion nanum]